MIESRIVAYDERIGLLLEMGIPFSTYWFDGILYFAFVREIDMISACELFGF